MTDRMDSLAKAATGKLSVRDCDVAELRTLVERYPYYAPAQFLLLHKLQTTADPDASVQHGKAILYYPDPLLFDYLFAASPTTASREQTVVSTERNEPEATPLVEILPLQRESTGSTAEELPKEEVVEEIAFVQIPEPAEAEVWKEEAVEPTEPLQAAPPVEAEESGSIDADVNVALPADAVDGSSNETVVEEPVNDTTTDESLPEPTQEVIHQKEADLPNEPDISPIAADEPTAGIDIKEVPAEPVQAAEEQPAPTAATEPDGLPALAPEPYHTVDYFASQGIKVGAEAFGNNKFDKSLRSFTDWLKTMKRLPAAEMQKTSDTDSEGVVVAMAANSVNDSTVVTEAMAEVWAKQGATEKARDIYHKLSLTNPSKRAYFAAKIEHLNAL